MRLRLVLSLFALLVMCTIAEAGPVRRLIEHHRQKKQHRHQAEVSSFAAPCTNCNPCTCPPGNCPAKCPVQSTVFGFQLVGPAQSCPDGKCPLRR